MKNFAFSLAAIVTAGAATFLATSPVSAGSQTVVVDTTQYDLNTAAGYAAVSERIDAAAEAVCGSAIARSITASLAAQQCQELAVQDGMEQLDALSRAPRVIIGASR